ncbi:MAG: LD-carboxypeptidase [Bacteroidales bacterium]|nr:LD-carboxypeptidase [Bacteroidales bacterium]
MMRKMLKPPSLSRGDMVALIAPAGFVERDDIETAIRTLESWGLEVSRGEHLYERHGIFAGTDKQRLSDLQRALDDPGIKAVICARGGYGMSRLIDKIDFSSFRKSPKWITGYSDITVLHLILNCRSRISTLHGEMPLNYHKLEAGSESLETLRKALFVGPQDYEWETGSLREGKTGGVLAGGNLSLIYNLMAGGMKRCLKGKILFIEEKGEYLYSFDRMISGLALAGVFRDIRGLIIGGLTDMKESDAEYSCGPVDIIMDCVKKYSYPVAFDFPAGHITDNRALVLGAPVSFSVRGGTASIRY